MTKEEIKNLRELIDLMLDKCVLVDSRTKVFKRLEEMCDLAIKALEHEPILDKIRAEIEEYKSKQLTLAIGVEDLEKGKQIALEYVLVIFNKYKVESEDI